MNEITAKNRSDRTKWTRPARKVDLSARFHDFVRTYRTWIAGSFVLWLLAGCLAAFVFNSWVVKASIRNVDGYFDLPMLTNIKHELPIILAAELEKISDEKLIRGLKPLIKNPQWPEKNIEPVFAILKNDVSKAILTRGGDFSAPAISFIEMTFKDPDPNQAKNIASWMSQAVIKTAFKEKYLAWVNGLRKSNEDALLKMQGGIAEQIVGRLNNEKQLEKTKEISAINSSSKAETSALPTPLVGSLINHDDLIKFLPINAQVDGLLLQKQQIEEGFDQTKFRIDFANRLIMKSIEATRIALAGSLTPPFYDNLMKKEFWESEIVSKTININAPGWKRDFIEATIENIHLTNSVFMNQLDYQLRNYQVSKPKRKFSRVMAILLGGFSGLLMTISLFLFINKDLFLGDENVTDEDFNSTQLTS